MGKRRCEACGERFTPCRHVPNQQYCSKPACQRERRRRWQRKKLQRDPDYRANQSAAQRRWRERHRDYWRNYRRTHPDYTARNREQQRQRNRNRERRVASPTAPPIANMDVYQEKTSIPSGTYRLIPEARPGVAKMDAYFVKIHVLSEAYSSNA